MWKANPKLCLDGPLGKLALAVLRPCTKAKASQKWSFHAGAQQLVQTGGLCLHAQPQGAKVTIDECQPSFMDQQWAVGPPPGTLVSQSTTFCLTGLAGHKPSEGNTTQATCKPSSADQWTFV
jgi:hypothetical protein